MGKPSVMTLATLVLGDLSESKYSGIISFTPAFDPKGMRMSTSTEN